MVLKKKKEEKKPEFYGGENYGWLQHDKELPVADLDHFFKEGWEVASFTKPYGEKWCYLFKRVVAQATQSSVEEAKIKRKVSLFGQQHEIEAATPEEFDTKLAELVNTNIKVEA